MEEVTAFESGRQEGFVQHLANLYVSPGTAFVSIVGQRSFWAPLVGLLVLNIAFTAVWLQKVDRREFMKARIEESPRADQIPPGQMEQIVETQARFLPLWGWGGAVLGAAIMVFGLAGLFLFVYRFFYEGELGFGQSAAVVAWSFLAVALVQTPLMLLTLFLKGDWTVPPQNALEANLGMLLDRETTAKPLHALASSLDLFSFWTMFLLSSGYAVATRRPTASAAWGVVTLWAIYVLIKMGFSMLF
jgi:hypothetical protein